MEGKIKQILKENYRSHSSHSSQAVGVGEPGVGGLGAEQALGQLPRGGLDSRMLQIGRRNAYITAVYSRTKNTR